MHHKLIFKHREKISYHAKIYASREDFMPRWNLCIARGFHASRKVMHHGKIHTSEKFTYRGKIFMPLKKAWTAKKEIVHPKRNIYPSASTVFFYFDKSKYQEEHQRRHQYKYHHCICFIYFRHQMKNSLKITLHA